MRPPPPPNTLSAKGDPPERDATPHSRRARFSPKRVDTLRPSMGAHVGKVFRFDYAGLSDENEPYPGQWRWMFGREHDDELGGDRGRWVPDEDLDDEDIGR